MSSDLGKMIEYLVNIRIVDLPLIIAYVAIMGAAAYCASMIIIGFPVAIIEAILKRKLDTKKEKKVIIVAGVVLFGFFVFRLLWEVAVKR